MPRYFFDSSALAKAYHAEIGTPKVLALLTEAGSEFFISSLTVIEIQSVFSLKVRDGRIDEAVICCSRSDSLPIFAAKS